MNGGISSVLIYNRVLTDIQRNQIEGYLAWKWWDKGSAILTNTSHPYYSVSIGDVGTIFNPINPSVIPFPVLIPGCANYFTADDGIIMSSNLVSSWTDYSTNGNNAVQSTAAYQPTYQPNGLNNLPCLYFNGTTTNMCLNCPSFGSTGSTLTYFVVLYMLSKPSINNAILGTSGTYAAGSVINVGLSSTNQLHIFLQSGYSDASFLPSTGQPFLLCVTISANGSSSQINSYINGTPVQITNIQSITSTTINFSSVNIGGWYNGPMGGTMYGAISSVIIYNSILSTTQRQQVEGFLAWKWWGTGTAILQNTHPYYYAQPDDIGTMFNPKSVS